jgi:hypothetical protein
MLNSKELMMLDLKKIVKKVLKQNPKASQATLAKILHKNYGTREFYKTVNQFGARSINLDQPAVCRLLKGLKLQTANHRGKWSDERGIIVKYLSKHPTASNKTVNRYVHVKLHKKGPLPTYPYSGRAMKKLRQELGIVPNVQGRWFKNKPKLMKQTQTTKIEKQTQDFELETSVIQFLEKRNLIHKLEKELALQKEQILRALKIE